MEMNYFSIEEPCCNITIGIKEGKVINVNWSDLLECEHGCVSNLSDINVQKTVIQYLKDALKMIKKNNKGE